MIVGYTHNCPLCRLVQDREILTRLVLEDELILVTDCVVCLVPMAVLKFHRISFTGMEKEHVRNVFRRILKENPLPLADDAPMERILRMKLDVINPRSIPWVIDWEQRKIPEHAHCHLRLRAFPNTKLWETL